MPITYGRDDQRQLITVTVTDPCSVDDVLNVIDRQASEGTWGYAMLYDLRGVTQASNEADLHHLADRVKLVGAGHKRGPVGLAIRARPAMFLVGLMYTELTREIVNVEVLLNAAQIDAWLDRNARGGHLMA